MPSAEVLWAFLGALLLLEITPGPDMMLVMARGVGQGRRTALCTVIGMVFVAGIVQISLLVLGLAALAAAYPMALTALQWVGAAYLVWLGIKTLRTPSAPPSQVRATPAISDLQAIRQGAINSLTNPKSLLFMFAFLPQFVDAAQGPVWSQLLVLGTLQKLTGIASLGTVALAAGAVGQWLQRHPTMWSWPEKFTGLVMLGLGIRLLLTDTASSTSAALKA